MDDRRACNNRFTSTAPSQDRKNVCKSEQSPPPVFPDTFDLSLFKIRSCSVYQLSLNLSTNHSVVGKPTFCHGLLLMIR